MGNDMPKENMHYTCIACITIDSVLTIDKKNLMSRFINTELKSDPESDLDSELEKIEKKIESELESGSDSE